MTDYVIVGLLVAAAAAYAVWRTTRALGGRGGCAFMDESCRGCPGSCAEAEKKEAPPDEGERE